MPMGTYICLKNCHFHAKVNTGHYLTILPAERWRSVTVSEDAPAYGVLSASRYVSLDEMEIAIRVKGGKS